MTDTPVPIPELLFDGQGRLLAWPQELRQLVAAVVQPRAQPPVQGLFALKMVEEEEGAADDKLTDREVAVRVHVVHPTLGTELRASTTVHFAPRLLMGDMQEVLDTMALIDGRSITDHLMAVGGPPPYVAEIEGSNFVAVKRGSEAFNQFRSPRPSLETTLAENLLDLESCKSPLEPQISCLSLPSYGIVSTTRRLSISELYCS